MELFPHINASKAPKDRMTVALSSDADVIGYVNLCNNTRGKSQK
jgi:hypothetical protein